MIVLGHRGYSAKYLENTLEAFLKAIEAGADGIELDVRSSKDGKIVVFHDEDLRRLFNIDVKIRDATVEDLKRLTGGKVITLDEVYSHISDDKIINVEIKERSVARSVLELSKDRKNVIFSSFDLDLLDEQFKGTKYGYLVDDKNYGTVEFFLERVERERPYSLHLPYQLFEMNEAVELVKKFRDMGIKVFVWTLNDPVFFQEIKDHIDGVITDEVEIFVKLR
ncbi:glycerophosphodiester phosphodiesterase family protein [Thermotoga sp. KOL6]|uniref:glycerophosphodiester phosphodiesterase family protein n=1 Tax=Thermotoga sp. KOL6 TaxID=126741 RepID=UPI000C75E99B|nr:glycerophosphodiester phosphodiesterase family protein [Thermotoga sp. KOL6]PLV60273.1 glycerophosphodiester phosphodiesterase [Thermotoga sp. KOL6]